MSKALQAHGKFWRDLWPLLLIAWLFPSTALLLFSEDTRVFALSLMGVEGVALWFSFRKTDTVLEHGFRSLHDTCTHHD